MITAVENATLLTNWGAGVKLNENSLSSYKITYDNEYKQRKAEIVSPKDREKFIGELALYTDREVILINNTESAFKKKKDDL